MMEKTLILKHILWMLCLLISYSKFTRTLISFILTKQIRKIKIKYTKVNSRKEQKTNEKTGRNTERQAN